MATVSSFQIAIGKKPDNELTKAVSEVEVRQTIEGPYQFRIRFPIDISDGDLSLVDDRRLKPRKPDTEVAVIAFANDKATCLINGVITKRRFTLMDGGAGSFLEIMGEDRRVQMTREQKFKAWEGTPAEIAEKILKEYEFETDVKAPEIEFTEDGHTLNQRDDDLNFIQQLAGRHDVQFWVDCKADTNFLGELEIEETAHFKPSPDRPVASGGFGLPVPLPPLLGGGDDCKELKLNAGNKSNFSKWELEASTEAPTRSGSIIRVNIDDAALDDDEAEPTIEALGEIEPPKLKRTKQIVTAGSVEEAQVANQAALNDASWTVSAQAETTVHDLGTVVRPHEILPVSGGGKLNDGDYFIKAVTHVIDPVKHTMTIELLRNALGD